MKLIYLLGGLYTVKLLSCKFRPMLWHSQNADYNFLPKVFFSFYNIKHTGFVKIILIMLSFFNCKQEETSIKWKWKWKWRDIRPSMVTHTRNLCSAINPSKVHTHSSEHTHREHTPGAVGSHLCCGARGAVGGSVPCSRAPQSWYWRRREHCTFTPPTYNSCRTWDRLSNH